MKRLEWLWTLASGIALAATPAAVGFSAEPPAHFTESGRLPAITIPTGGDEEPADESEREEADAAPAKTDADCNSCNDPLLTQCLDGCGLGAYANRFGLNIGGWLEQGYTWNPDRPKNRFNFPNTFNDRANEYQLNQLYMFVEKPVEYGCDWDFGGRVDLFWGSDYYFTESLGLETEGDGTQKWNSDNGPRFSRGLFVGGVGLYGWAMPQLYAEVFAPVGNGLSVKMGHFYTIMGSESVMAPENFFYSHTYMKQYAEPFTHTGVLGDYRLTDQTSVQLGVTRGWDTWEDNNDELGFLGGVRWVSCDGSTSVALAMHTGDERCACAFDSHRRDAYTLVVQRRITECLTYLFQTDYGWENEGAFDRRGQAQDAEWYGIHQALIYDLNQCLSVGARFEWFRDDDHTRILEQGAFAEGGNYFDFTLGLNWRPYERITVRPEARWDWSDAAPGGRGGVFDDFSDTNQFTLALDVIWTF